MTEPNFGGRKVAIKALVGSHNYNLNTAESDKDWKFFVIPTFDDLYFGNMFAEGNQSDEMDYSAHDIRKLTELMWKANLNFLEVLFSQNFITSTSYSYFTGWLRANRDEIADMNLRSFYGCCMGMHNQKMGTLLKGTAKTQILVDSFGYDTKDALHAYRLLIVLERVAQGMPLGEALWFDGEMRDNMLFIKSGGLSVNAFKTLVNDWFVNNYDIVTGFFSTAKQNTALRDEMDARTKKFIREWFS